MKLFTLCALAAIAQLQLVAANDTPYCTAQYFSTSICAKFKLPKGVDCNPNGGNPYDLNMHHPSKFTSARAREFAVGITNVFENSQPQNDYATCTNIGDGRGFTCGSGGYTSDDGSMQDPLQRYAKLTKQAHKKNALGKYMAEINKIADGSNCSPFRGAITGLAGLDTTWTRLGCTDPIFRKAQDAAAFSEIDQWAMAHAAFYGIKTNLGLAVFRDTMEQHGDGGGEPHIGIEVIGRHAKAAFNGKKFTEKQFIAMFLQIRRELLCCYRPETKGKKDLTWPESADRISDLQYLVKTGNWDLKPPIKLPAYQVTIKSNFDLTAAPSECKHIKRDFVASNKVAKRRHYVKRTPFPYAIENSTYPFQLDQ